jgi:hypothetical protein
MPANLPIKTSFREATIQDIPQIQMVRHSVRENVLSDPGLVTDKDCADYLIRRGRGWVCESDGKIVGFSIADLTDQWLGTSPNTRVESFYRRAGWKETGIHGKGEIKFEMNREEWLDIRRHGE